MTDTYKEEICALRSEGKTYAEIKSALGCSKSTIAYHIGEGQKQKVFDRSTRRRTNQKRKLWDIKEESGCADCGEKYPHWMLDFDHKPEFKKEGNVGQMLQSYSWEKAMVELEKCDIVCANCHRIRTYGRNQNKYKDN